jgi:hypothetical protein
MKRNQNNIISLKNRDQDLLDESSESDNDVAATPIYTQNRHTGRQLVKNDSRRIQSMQNLHIDKSRSNSADTLDNTNDNLQIDISSNKDRKSKILLFMKHYC